MLDPFTTNDAYTLFQLALAMETIPTQYGRITELGIFRSEGINKTSVGLEKKENILNLLSSANRGSRADAYLEEAKRKVYQFNVPHFPIYSSIMAESYQGIRQFGTQDSLVDMNMVLSNAMIDMRRRMDITLEWLYMTAIRGVLLDSDTSELVDYFDVLGGSRESIDFDLDTSTTNVLDKCVEATDFIDDNCYGETITGYHAFCSPEFFDKLRTHDTVKEAFMYTNAAPSVLAQDSVVSGSGANKVRQFSFGGITFERYRGSATDSEGTTRKFIAAQHASLIPLGTRNIFVRYDAPGTLASAVNTIGRQYYLTVENRSFGTGYDLFGQMNPLPLVSQPLVCVDLHY